MTNHKPIVSIGLPVYNGANFLREALDSVLAQTFQDFELIISDNASTDKTKVICQQYAAKDQRIRYYRNEKNLGAAKNYNQVFDLCSGKYFMWLAHDDVIATEYLERCVEILEQNPSIVLCHSQVRLINDKGQTLQENDQLYQKYPCLKNYHAQIRQLNTDSPQPQERFLARITAGTSLEFFGLFRMDVLRAIPDPHGSYSGADEILLAKVALLGRFYEIPEPLFSSRQHLQQSGMFALNPDGKLDHSLYSTWFAPEGKDSKFIAKYNIFWKLNYEYAIAILQSPLNQEAKIDCFRYLIQASSQPSLLYKLGELAQREGQNFIAEQLWTVLLRLQPNSVNTWFALGNLYQENAQLPKAEAAYRQALALQPNLVAIHNNLGYTLEQQEKLPEAIACYQKALELQPNCAEAEVNLANILNTQGQLSTEQQAHYAVVNNNLGFGRKQVGDLETAIAYYRQAIALKGDLAIANYNLGMALQDQGKLEEMLSCYQKASALANGNTGVYDQLLRNKLKRIAQGQNQSADSQKKLKIAFVNQYCDTMLPPVQNSVGACTYGIARPLADCCDVMVYGLKQDQKIEDNYYAHGVHYKFLSPARFDLWLLKNFPKYAQFSKIFNGGMIPPISTSNWIFPLYGREIARDLVIQQCDIIIFQHTTQYIPIVRALNPQAKIILNFHHERYPQSNRAMLEKRLRHVDFVTCTSGYITEKTRQDFPLIAERCQTIYNGINASDFALEKDYRQARQRKVKRLMYAGAVSPEKGIHILLDAFKIVVQQYPEVQLEIFGPQGARPLMEIAPQQNSSLFNSISPFYAINYLEHLQEKVDPAIAGKVSFPGIVPKNQLINNLFNADIFVFPSLWDEGFGLPPVEAMAAGTAVVATRSGAVVETVQDDKTGLLVEKNDASALANAILKLLKNDELRESMGRAARQRALSHFTWEHSADMMLQLCETL